MKTRSAATATVVASAKKTAAAKKKNQTTKKPKVAIPTVTKSTMSSCEDDKPWFHIFTKGDEEYNTYMANEWGFEKRGDQALFEKISLEGAQSGLSWLTVLRKRDAYRRVFFGFDVDRVAKMTEQDVERILNEQDAENTRNIIVRHRGKVESVINNAKCIQKLVLDSSNDEDEKKNNMPTHGVFDELLWTFVNDKPILNVSWKGGDGLKDAPTQTQESKDMSKKLKQLGFRFVGPTTCYAMMQSVGMVLDHPVGSKEWKEAKERLEKRKGGYQER
ncbi:unnamed protein product [Cylindrotheca closterium]|uniref:DNA-3-methyladenine glycosylase I n=1 Tax=Cylindrotheca closterium TaxID=2856 RepID=A0AAD2FQF2_9STRA|nr:unnamed protein product [Cylindrotheca closterium]